MEKLTPRPQDLDKEIIRKLALSTTVIFLLVFMLGLSMIALALIPSVFG